VLDRVNRRDRFSMKNSLRSSAKGASVHTKHASNANVVRVVLLDANSHLALRNIDETRSRRIIKLIKKLLSFSKKQTYALLHTYEYIHNITPVPLGQAEITSFHLLRSLHTPFASCTFIKFLIHARRFRVLLVY
jgi:hypothetical protein